jgi:hypothetical protein
VLSKSLKSVPVNHYANRVTIENKFAIFCDGLSEACGIISFKTRLSVKSYAQFSQVLNRVPTHFLDIAVILDTV